MDDLGVPAMTKRKAPQVVDSWCQLVPAGAGCLRITTDPPGNGSRDRKSQSQEFACLRKAV